MLATQTSKKKTRRQKRQYIRRKVYANRICKICGSEFTPHSPLQQCCTKECMKANQKEKQIEWLAQRPGYAKEHYHLVGYEYKSASTCKICGKKVENEFTSDKRRSSKQMHDECVFNDCIKSLKETGTINTIQAQRLAARGWTKKEFIDEYFQTV